MSSSLAYSTFEKEEKEGFRSTEKKRKNKTIKKNSKKVETFLNGLASMENNDDNSNLADLGDFPPQPQITKQPEPTVENKTSTDEAVTPSAYAEISAD